MNNIEITEFRRSIFLTEKVMTLRLRHFQRVNRTMLTQHRRLVDMLRLKARLEYKMQCAQINREKIIESKRLKNAMRVERAKTVALVVKMQRLIANLHGEDNSFCIKNNEFETNENVNFLENYILPIDIIEDMSEYDYKRRYLNHLPPINRFTLRELGLEEILTNEQLRHNILFDEKLRFKPSDTQSDTFEEYFNTYVPKRLQSHLPLLLLEIREMIFELIPLTKDLKEELMQMMDVVLSEKQMRHKTFNFASYMKSVGNVLKENCSEARDYLVDRINDYADMGLQSDALRNCFIILEKMKLDYANHNLEVFKPHIKRSAVLYERKNFEMQYKDRPIERTRSWWAAIKKPQHTVSDLVREGVMYLIEDSDRLDENVLPETYRLDHSNLTVLHNDLQDVTVMACVMLHHRQLQVRFALKNDGVVFDAPEQVKRSIWVLLNDTEVTLDHLSLYLVQPLHNLVDEEEFVREKNQVKDWIDRLLAKNAPLFAVMKSKVMQCLSHYLQHQTWNEDQLKAMRLSLFKDELKSVAVRLDQVIRHHDNVYHSLYANL